MAVLLLHTALLPGTLSQQHCEQQPGVQYLRPDHYKQVNDVASSDACCDACAAEGEGRCGSWKYEASKEECRLLATAPTKQEHDNGFVSGTMRAPPMPSDLCPSSGTC